MKSYIFCNLVTEKYIVILFYLFSYSHTHIYEHIHLYLLGLLCMPQLTSLL